MYIGIYYNSELERQVGKRWGQIHHSRRRRRRRGHRLVWERKLLLDFQPSCHCDDESFPQRFICQTFGHGRFTLQLMSRFHLENLVLFTQCCQYILKNKGLAGPSVFWWCMCVKLNQTSTWTAALCLSSTIFIKQHSRWNQYSPTLLILDKRLLIWLIFRWRDKDHLQMKFKPMQISFGMSSPDAPQSCWIQCVSSG